MKKHKLFRSGFSWIELLMCVAIIGLMAAIALPQVARADDAGIVWTSGTNSIVNNTTTTANLGGAVKIDKQHFVALVTRFSGSAAGTDNIVFQVARSYDGTTFETSPPTSLKFTNALNGTTAVVGYHEIPQSLIASAHSLKIVGVQNYSATVLATNAAGVSCAGFLKKMER